MHLVQLPVLVVHALATMVLRGSRGFGRTDDYVLELTLKLTLVVEI